MLRWPAVRWLDSGYWSTAGALLAAGPGISLGGLPGANAITLVGVIGVVVLSLTRRAGSWSLLIGLVIGLNLSVVALLINPPCMSISHLQLVRLPSGSLDVVCTEFQDTRGLALFTFAGSVAILGLKALLRHRIAARRQQANPDVVDVAVRTE